jgi:meso-butanediol dehydrogenase / (S,S)-butanediol dehydrogenase / diacetyl reductase
MSKVIAITGANGGLGRALAKMFCANGHSVVLLGRSLAKVGAIANEIGKGALAVACEVTSPDSVRAAFAEIAKTHPKIDVVINNAAIFQPFLLEEASDSQILDGVLTNLAGPMLVCRSAIPMMEKGGHIINLSSESVEVPFPHLLNYQSTKAGLERFSKGLHMELEEKGIRVTVVRAGQMMGEGQSAEMDPEAAGRLFHAAAKRGIHFMERGMTAYDSATTVFRNLIDLPADMHVELVTYQGRRAE